MNIIKQGLESQFSFTTLSFGAEYDEISLDCIDIMCKCLKNPRDSDAGYEFVSMCTSNSKDMRAHTKNIE